MAAALGLHLAGWSLAERIGCPGPSAGCLINRLIRTDVITPIMITPPPPTVAGI